MDSTILGPCLPSFPECQWMSVLEWCNLIWREHYHAPHSQPKENAIMQMVHIHETMYGTLWKALITQRKPLTIPIFHLQWIFIFYVAEFWYLTCGKKLLCVDWRTRTNPNTWNKFLFFPTRPLQSLKSRLLASKTDPNSMTQEISGMFEKYLGFLSNLSQFNRATFT